MIQTVIYQGTTPTLRIVREETIVRYDYVNVYIRGYSTIHRILNSDVDGFFEVDLSQEDLRQLGRITAVVQLQYVIDGNKSAMTTKGFVQILGSIAYEIANAIGGIGDYEINLELATPVVYVGAAADVGKQRIVVQNSDIMLNNNQYIIATADEINITIPSEDEYIYEYVFSFTCGDTPKIVNFPSDVSVAGSSILANGIYEVKIMNNLAKVTRWTQAETRSFSNAYNESFN